EASMLASSKNEHLLDALLRDSRLTKVMTEKEIRDAMNPANYVGGAPVIADNMVAAVEKALKKKV
ncbi:MAG: hypothetical protein FWF40_00345, partial [Methanomassiliicoccaceae archaeon]|nr:hypothetical protein [Methanomassiliicoccaceae archaeon]